MMFSNLRVNILLVLLLTGLNLFAQDQAKVDSLENLLTTSEGREKFNILIELSATLIRIDPALSHEYGDEAISLAQDLGNIELELQSYIHKGYLYEAREQDGDALKMFQRALQFCEDKNYKEGKPQALYRIGRSYHFQSEIALSDEFLTKALELARETKDIKTEAQALYMQAENYRASNKPDSAILKYDEAIPLAEKAEDLSTLAFIYQNMASLYNIQGDFNAAIRNYKMAKSYREAIGDRLRSSSIELNIANAYFNLSKYDSAIESYQVALTVFEEYNYKRGIAAVYNGMASIYVEQEFYDKALENHFKKLDISREMGDQLEVGNTLNNIGIVYSRIASDSLINLLGPEFQDSIIEEPTDKYLNIFSMALDYYHQALAIREQLNDKPGLAKTLNNIGTAYLHSGKLDMALRYFERSAAISEELSDINELALTLNKLGAINMYKKQYDRALAYLNQSLAYALQIDVKSTVMDVYRNLSDVYARLNNYQRALEYYRLASAVKDSISKKDTRDMITEMQVKYETEGLEKDNKLLMAESQLSSVKLRQQRIAIIFFMFILLLISILVVLLIRQNNQRKRTNMELAQKNALITEQKKEITDSIHYASRIQSAILPPGDYIDKLIPHRFIIYMPRDIVSGDYYWITEKNDKVICIAADCTGHGVPGAFMSMLGIAFLNEIISKQDEFHTEEIMNDLRNHVIKSLHQTGKEGESQDGMDLALYILDPKNMTLEFSGANNSLFLFRNGEFIELKADKMPIGIHTRANESFTRHKINIQKNDMIYTFSDGYPDQFGGRSQKKFMIKNFKNLLSQVHLKSMEEQKEVLVQALKDWMADTAQVDDILVIGVRV